MRVLVLVGMVAGIGIGGCERIPGTDQHIMAKGKAAAADLLIDPSSAQFRRVELRKVPSPDDQSVAHAVVCGEINGKNRFGAYSGFRRFISAPWLGTRLELDISAVDKNDLSDANLRSLKSGITFWDDWEKLCGN